MVPKLFKNKYINKKDSHVTVLWANIKNPSEPTLIKGFVNFGVRNSKKF